MKQRGVDIQAFDNYEATEEEASSSHWTDVQMGGPEKLHGSNRTLLLCYPDEANSLAKECLDIYEGDYIIHVGELAAGPSGGTLSCPQAPWGRTTSAEFQVALAEEFHCLLSVAIPRYPFSRDCLSVWKRTQWMQGKPTVEEDDDDEEEEEENEEVAEEEVGEDGGRQRKRKRKEGDNESDSDDGSSHDNNSSSNSERGNLWAAIPLDELLPRDVAAPCLAHLL